MTDQPFWWFEGQSVERLTEQLVAAGAGARLEVRLRAEDKLFLTVVKPDGHGHDPIDDSRPCPPVCPSTLSSK